MVLMSIEQFSALTDSLERRLDEADRIAEVDSTRCTAD